MAEKFSVPELSALRQDLQQNGLDSRELAEVLQIFLTGRGYGVAPDAARDATIRMNGSGLSLEVMQSELNRIAMVQ
jgi:hypothetical protein